MNIQNLQQNFIEFKSFFGSNSPFLLYVRQTWMTHLILAISLWGNIFLWSERILLLICMVLKDFCLYWTYLQKTLWILTYVFEWLYFTMCLNYFSSINHCLCLYAQFFIVFHLTKTRFSRSTHLLMCLTLETLTPIIGTG